MNEIILTTVLVIVLLLIASLSGFISWRLKVRAIKKMVAEHGGNLDQRLADEWADWLPNFWQGITTEMVGAVVTTLLFGIVLVGVQNIQNRAALLEDLTFDMSSPVNQFAVEAVRNLRRIGWLTDGSLQDADFTGADLSDAPLQEADLRGASFVAATLDDADLSDANLSRVNFTGANADRADFERSLLIDANFTNAGLEEADFIAADLVNAIFDGADLRNGVSFANADARSASFINANFVGENRFAFFNNANLRGADFTGANLTGANLWNADLTNANLDGTIFGTDETNGARLPDFSLWTPGTDMARFSDPLHPDYWRSSSLTSPAFDG